MRVFCITFRKFAHNITIKSEGGELMYWFYGGLAARILLEILRNTIN